MKNLHFKIGSRWIKSMLSWIMKSNLFYNPSDLMLVSCLTWFSSPESLISFLVRIILQSDCIDLINWLVKNYFRRSVVRNKCEYTLLPVIVCLNCSIVHKCDVHWWCCGVEYIAIWEIPVSPIISITPIILLLNIWYCGNLFLRYLN
jgi:hypothetical protein